MDHETLSAIEELADLSELSGFGLRLERDECAPFPFIVWSHHPELGHWESFVAWGRTAREAVAKASRIVCEWLANEERADREDAQRAA